MVHQPTQHERFRPVKVILHCSDTPDYRKGDKKFDRFGAEDIRSWHTLPPPAGRGWSDIGYHFVIRRNGEIEQGRSADTQGAHCMGQNHDSIGVCWVGTSEITDAQVDALKRLGKMIKRIFKIGWTGWFGHREFNPKKSCPGVSMALVRGMLNQ